MNSLSYILANPSKRFSTKEISEALRISQYLTQRAIKKGELRADLVAGRYIVSGQDVFEYLEKWRKPLDYQFPAQRNE